MRLRFFVACIALILLGAGEFDRAVRAQEAQYLPKPLRRLLKGKTEAGSPQAEAQTALAAQAAVKITVREAGLYRVEAEQLMAAGLPPRVVAARLQLFEGGVEYPLNVVTNGDSLSYIEFYGVGADTRETDTRAYWLIVGDRPGLRFGPPGRGAPRGGNLIIGANVESQFAASGSDGKSVIGDGFIGGYAVAATQSPSEPDAVNFPFTVVRQERAYYFNVIQNGGEVDNFFGGAVRNTPEITQTWRVKNLDPTAQTPAVITVTLQGATSNGHRAQVKLNGQAIGQMQFADQENHTARFTVAQSLLQEGDNTLSYLSLNGAGDISVLDTARITYTRRMLAENDRLLFTAAGRRLAVGGFNTNGIRVFDLTNPARAFSVATRVASGAAGYTVNFNSDGFNRTFFAVGEGQTLTPVSVTANEPSTLAQTENRADFLILTHRDFRAALEPLAQARRAEGLRTEIVTLEDVFDEWNGGNKSGNAVRGFLRHTQTNWAVRPRYVLLVGDSSYDPRNYLGQGNYDFLPTAYTNTDFGETATDIKLADANGDDIEDFALGRMPVRTAAQATRVVAKILNYRPFAGPRPDLLLVTDHADDNAFELAHDYLRLLLPGGVSVREARRLGLTNEQMRAQTLAGLNDGPAIVQYSGHGLIAGWSSAGFLTSDDAPELTNQNRHPIILTMSCLNGYFQDVHAESLAEALLKAPNGAAAVWASTALTYADGQVSMSHAWFQQIYADGPAPRLGDATRNAKAASYDALVRRTWLLFGDPTLQVRN